MGRAFATVFGLAPCTARGSTKNSSERPPYILLGLPLCGGCVYIGVQIFYNFFVLEGTAGPVGMSI